MTRANRLTSDREDRLRRSLRRQLLQLGLFQTTPARRSKDIAGHE
jgi:hypothetical protein